MKVKGNINIAYIKRCYVDRQINLECPFCKGNLVFDLDEQYISYPELDVIDQIGTFCKGCDTFVNMPYKLNKTVVHLTVYPDQLSRDI